MSIRHRSICMAHAVKLATDPDNTPQGRSWAHKAAWSIRDHVAKDLSADQLARLDNWLNTALLAHLQEDK